MAWMFIYVSCLFNVTGNHLTEANPPEVPLMDISEFQALRASDRDTLYVINFWSTWCKPCLKELPYFEQIHEEFTDKPVKVILVSLDLPQTRDERVAQLIQEKNLNATVRVLKNTNPNYYIPIISDEWQGNIPATVVLHPKSGLEKLYAKELTYTELKSIIEPLIPHP